MPVHYYVSAIQLLGAEDIIEGGAPALLRLMDKAGIDPSVLKTPDSIISFQAMVLLHEIAARDFDNEAIGIKWALDTPAHFPNLGPLVLMGRVTKNIQEWIDLGQKYWKFHTNAFSMQQLTDVETGLAIFRYVVHSPAQPSRHYAEHAIANMVLLARKATGYEDENPVLVRFQHGPPRDLTLHNRVFRCTIEFNAKHTEILFRPEYLTRETVGGLTFLKPVVGYYVRHRIRRLPIYDQTLTTTVELAVPSVMGTGKCNIEFISESIGLSAKKLRRLLAAEGTTFSDILERVRERMARELLANTDTPIASIAGLLDYSSPPPFTLAFKRWTGLAPIEYRKSARGNQ
jgi:AraC-like DNA-binding protein